MKQLNFKSRSFKGSGRAYTLVEVLIAAGVLTLVFATVIGLYVYFMRGSKEDSKDQEYYRLYSSLEARVKADIRSARSVSEDVPGVFTLERLMELEPGMIKVEKVVYWVNDSGLGVDRFETSTNKKIRYDFSSVLEPGQNFEFRINP